MMDQKPTYKELEQRIKTLENKAFPPNKTKRQSGDTEATYRLMLESISDTVILTDDFGNMVYVCPNTTNIFGFSQEEIYAQQTIQKFMNGSVCDITEIKRKGGIENIERSIKNSSGDVRYLLINAKSVNINSGTILYVMRDITDRRVVEGDLEKYKNIVSSTTDGIAFLDRNYRYIIVNDAYEKFSNVDRKNFIGKTVSEYLSEDIFKKYIKDKFDRALRGEIVNYQEWFEYPTLGRRFVDITYSPYRGNDNQILGLIANTRDVTERKQAEEALRKSENQISSIFRSAPIGIGLVVNRELKEVNSRLCTTTGYDEGELIGQSSRILYPSDEDFEFVGHEKYAQIQISDHGTGTVETHWQRKDGTIIDVLLSSTPVDFQHHSKGVTFAALDISKRKRAEEALQDSHKQFLTVLDSIDNTIYVADMETYEILFMNQHMIDSFGQDMTGEICWKAFRGESAPCLHCNNDKLVDKNNVPTGVIVWEDENPKTGKRYINHDRAIEWTDGRLVRLQIATDITDLLSMEAQLRQAQKMESVGRLAGGVAHDFNNMLGVILGHAELAMEDLDRNQPIFNDLQQIRQAANRSTDITRQLLAFARKQIVSPKVIDLNETVAGMLKMLLRLIGENIDLAWLPGKRLWPIKIDPSQIDQILVNLCVNARDAIVDVGKITIETENCTLNEEYCSAHAGFVTGQYVKIDISDNGSGMDKETVSHIFEPFFTTKGVNEGTGLGLATVYGIVKQNNGFVNVYSEQGRGTTFSIYLPRYADKTNTGESESTEEPARRGSETILLVEDEPTILSMTTTMLQRLGYTVLVAGTPSEAVRLADEYSEEIHLVLTDVVMPEINGRILTEKLMVNRPKLKCLFMSGYTANVISLQGVLDDGVDFIQKPFAKRELAAKIRQALSDG